MDLIRVEVLMSVEQERGKEGCMQGIISND